jgi:hypothetical protein
MTAVEFKAQLANHQVEQQMHADKLRKQAAETRTNARSYAASHVGDAMEPARQRILSDAEDKAQTLEGQAARAARRSQEAGAGRYLCTSVEWRDSAYMTNPVHQQLLASAQQFGVVVSEDEMGPSPTNRRFG